MSTESQIANGANITTGTTAATGAIGSGLTLGGYLESNATIIIMSCTVLSLIVALTFHLINSRINKNRLALQRADKIDQWLSEGKSMDDIEKLLELAKGLS